MHCGVRARYASKSGGPARIAIAFARNIEFISGHDVPIDSPAALSLTKEELLSRLESVWREVLSSVTEPKELGDLQVRAELPR